MIRTIQRPYPPTTYVVATSSTAYHNLDFVLQDFILSILRANPSIRDTRAYFASFRPKPAPAPAAPTRAPAVATEPQSAAAVSAVAGATTPATNPLLSSILNPVTRRTALVKIQGPFTDKQLDSIARGLVYMHKLGLVSVIVLDNDDIVRGGPDERPAIVAETMRIVAVLERQGARARPVLGPVVRLGPKPGSEKNHVDIDGCPLDVDPPEAHALPEDLVPIRSALGAGDIPVISPFALDSRCRSVRIDANDLIAGLTQGMADVPGTDDSHVDLTPLRLMIINREGGVPSYARAGLPHLLINLTSEYDYIHDTFQEPWRRTHPTALANLKLAKRCLGYMPTSSSAVMVSHRSPSALIANLITNKPAMSSSLPHALLQGPSKLYGPSAPRLTPHTPTILRRGLAMRVVRSMADIDQGKLTALLEQSFHQTLDSDAYFARLERSLDFVIIAGDYVGAAIVTRESEDADMGQTGSKENGDRPTRIVYLDKFAVLPSQQGDGTVDFLWVALHDETYGLGLPFSANPNGGRGGQGEARDLVWKSRAENPVNKWYFERSTGHMRVRGDWVIFWCDAERALQIEEGRRGSAGLSFIEPWEHGRMARWEKAVMRIPSAWVKH
ncbi:mitochondrial amino-acid acetyltransferase [Fistulina hepatica ATCC 64428]|uniref:Amino-acid acetyltransferase, mitochondrial n=1 Tax=Fistulina hepatica ATCC 64428 TaxID=1128425 RepID=A0A0D7A4V9_9AGAR|nr:mitochondrial amino-acid acetyltransferase [Fistulina hepatica ATCC 64428]